MSTERVSTWQAEAKTPPFAALRGDTQCDVVVIGAGLTGLLTAHRSLRSGKTVVVLERDKVGAGTSGATTAHVTALVDAGYATLAKKFGAEGARRVARAMTRGIDELEELAIELSAGDFLRVPGYLLAHDASAVDDIREEHQALRDAGLAAELVQGVPFGKARLDGLMLPRQAQLDPMSLMSALALHIQALGGRVYERSPVTAIEDGEPCRVTTALGTVVATDVVMATHTPLGFSVVQTDVAPYRSYVASVRLAAPIEPGLYMDTDEPYHYVRAVSAADPSHVLIGGFDHKTGKGTENESLSDLEAYVRAHFDVSTIERMWSAQLYVPADDLPYIGKNVLADHVYIATGFNGDGMAFAAVASSILRDSILGVESAEADLFGPGRVKPIAAGKKFIKENADVARHFVGDRLSSEDERSLDAVGRGEGMLVQLGMRKVAAYRDHTGGLHVLRPVCSHLKCIVHWNAAETSWDCPCHGGRFNVDGQPIEGPPLAPLESYDTQAPAKTDDDRLPLLAVEPTTAG